MLRLLALAGFVTVGAAVAVEAPVRECSYLEPGNRFLEEDFPGARFSTITKTEKTTIRIKDERDKLVDKFEVKTGESFEFKTEYNDEPTEYKIIAENSDIESEKIFKIKEKQDIKIQIINKTLKGIFF